MLNDFYNILINSNNKKVLLLIILPAVFTIFWLRDAVQHLYKLGKSKTRTKKERKTFSMCNKFFLVGYWKTCLFYQSTAKNITIIYRLYIVTIAICFLLFFACEISFHFTLIFKLFVFIKCLLLDIPIMIYSFIMTKHDKKHGGVTWRW